MAHAILAFGNRADEATLSGGAAAPTLPLTNLQDRRMGRVWRSASLDLADTQFDVDFGGLKLFRVIALAAHTFSLGALYRIRVSTVADFSTVIGDSGWLKVWPSVYPLGTIPWGSPNFWAGTYSEEEIAYFKPLIRFIMPTARNARYVRIEIDDPDNAAGFVQAGRLFIADGWQPTRNMVYGAEIGWLSRTEVQEALSGAEYFDIRDPARSARFGLEAMTEDEAMAVAFDLLRRVGTHGECLFIWDPDDTRHALRRQFLCRLMELPMIANPGPNRWHAPFVVKELL